MTYDDELQLDDEELVASRGQVQKPTKGQRRHRSNHRPHNFDENAVIAWSLVVINVFGWGVVATLVVVALSKSAGG